LPFGWAPQWFNNRLAAWMWRTPGFDEYELGAFPAPEARMSVKDIRDYMKPPRTVREWMDRELADEKLRVSVESDVEKMRTEQDGAICAYPFDSTVCVAPAGHEGPHITSNERFPHGVARGVATGEEPRHFSTCPQGANWRNS
jgi:hypothetical protein